MLIWLASFLAAAALSYVLLLWLKPLLARHTLAKPNARSSHKVPTPQGGGIAVIAAVLLVATAGQIVLDQEPVGLIYDDGNSEPFCIHESPYASFEAIASSALGYLRYGLMPVPALEPSGEAA